MIDDTVRTLDLALSVAIGVGGVAVGFRDGELLLGLLGLYVLYQTWEVWRAQREMALWKERAMSVEGDGGDEWE